jgi:hypothetical protein
VAAVRWIIAVERDGAVLAKIDVNSGLILKFADEFGIHFGGSFCERLNLGVLVAVSEHAAGGVRGLTTEFATFE